MERTIGIPEHILVYRVRRHLEREGARLRAYHPNHRFHNKPGDWYIMRPTKQARPAGGFHFEGFAPEVPRYPTTIEGTLEDFAREIGVIGEREYHALR